MDAASLRQWLWLRKRYVEHAFVTIRAGLAANPNRVRELPDTYFVRPDYRTRIEPKYWDDQQRRGTVYQPDVYPHLASVARNVGAHTIVDFGCGDGEKLAALHPEFDVVGIDVGSNIAAASERHPFGRWFELDLDADETPPLDEQLLRSAVIVCSDVIEHLKRPEYLLGHLRRCLDVCQAVVLSTPERHRSGGWADLGPPRNAAHVREWTIDEFASLLACHGFHRGRLQLTRSSNRSPLRDTILATLYAEGRRRGVQCLSFR